MKNIIIALSILIIITGCKKQNTQVSVIQNEEQKEKSKIEINTSFNFEKTQSKDFSFIDSIRPIQLPVGNKLLTDYEFPKEWNFGSPYDKKRIITEDEKVINKLLGFHENYKSENYKESKNNLKSLNFYFDNKDYRDLSIDYDKLFNYGITRFPNKNDSIKVIALWFSKDEINPNAEFPFSVFYGDLITIYNNQITDKISISRFEGNYNLGGDYRKFYLDLNYTIYTKDFNYGENQGYFIRSEKSKIKDNGKIVRYFDQQDTIFKGGKVKNHLKTGKWMQANPDEVLVLKDKRRNIESIYSYSEGEYNEGEKIGEWEYYAYEGLKKGKLLYTETYKKGELIERVFEK